MKRMASVLIASGFMDKIAEKIAADKGKADTDGLM